MKLKARFIGKTNVEIINGCEYEFMVSFRNGMSITIGNRVIPYNSLSSFFRNWNNIVHVK